MPFRSLLVSVALLLSPASAVVARAQQDASTPAVEETRQEALERTLRELDETLDSGDDAAILDARLAVASAADDARDLTLAQEQASAANELARRLGDRAREARSLLIEGSVALHRNDYAEAGRSYAASAAIYEELGDSKALGGAYRSIGLSLRYQNEFEEALQWYRRALAQYEEVGDRSGLGETYNSIGAALARLGRFEAALDAHQTSLGISRELGQLDGVATSLYNIGDIYARLGDRDLAKEYFEDAHAIDLEVGNPADIAHSSMKLGDAWKRLGDFDQARSFAEEARRLFARIDAPRDVAWADSLLGEIALAAGDRTEASRRLRGALEVAVERGARSLEHRIRASLAEVALAEGDTATALEEVDRAIAGARSLGEAEYELEFVAIRTRILESRGDFREALASARDEQALQKSLFDRARASVIGEIQGGAESVRRQQELELVRKDRELAEARLERETFERRAKMAGVVLFALVATLAYGRLTQRRMNRRLRDEVSKQTRDLVEANLALEELGWSDPLTGARNRRYLDDRLPGLLARARAAYESDEMRPAGADLTLFLVDLDHFKRVNDELGHHAGDLVLTEVANRLRRTLRPDDILVRWGGEEFLAVQIGAPRTTGPEVAERLRRAIRDEMFVTEEGQPLPLTTSVGFAPYPVLRNQPSRVSFDEAVGLADDCLYRAKETGRDRWWGVVDDPEVVWPARRRVGLPDPGATEEGLRLLGSRPEGP